MDIAAVEDIQSLCPLELDDEGEGLPAYEESVSSGLSSFGAEDREGDVSPRSDKYSSQVQDAARRRLSEKEQIRRSYASRDASTGQEPSIRSSPSSIFSHDTALPAYQPPLAHPSRPHGSGSALTRSLSRKYANSRQTQKTELTRTGLARIDFGSAFAQQSRTTITCALSLYGGALVLFGTADGLRVASVSEEVPVRVVWTGLAVWDIRVLRCVEDGDKTPRGSVAVLCGGQEDPARPGRPKGKSGEVEVRVWRLGSLASLAKWTAGREMGWKGLDMAEGTKDKGKAKGKERSFFSPFRKASSSAAVPAGNVLDDPTIPLAEAWSADWIRLDARTTGKSADVLAFSLRQQGETVYIAIATTTHILLHIGVVVPSGVSFRSTRKFYLPFAPAAIGLLEVLTPNGEPSLGIWISFSTGGMSMASVIRNSDSAVLDFSPPSGQGAGRGGSTAPAGSAWTEMQNVWTNGREVYAFHRGGETIVYPAPLRLPIAVPPIIHTTWPRTPLSSLIVPDGDDLLLITTSKEGEICTQRARANGEAYTLDLQDGTQIGEGRLLPLAWGYIRDGVYASVREMKDWRICAIEKV